MYGQKIVVVKRKKSKGGGGGHGGSWKVAYADFVTAMMAFFLVMWIMGMNEGVRDLVQGYFNNPVGFRRAYSGGMNPVSAGNALTNLNVQRSIMMTRQSQARQFEETAEELERNLEAAGIDVGEGSQVQLSVTNEGLRIEIMETVGGALFFQTASSNLEPAMLTVLESVAESLIQITNDVVVEGHTDGAPFVSRAGYTNWELSVDRANAARRVLVDQGVSPGRFAEVRGYADRQLKVVENPRDPRNRRISMLIPFAVAEVEFTAGDLERMLTETGVPETAFNTEGLAAAVRARAGLPPAGGGGP